MDAAATNLNHTCAYMHKLLTHMHTGCNICSQKLLRQSASAQFTCKNFTCVNFICAKSAHLVLAHKQAHLQNFFCLWYLEPGTVLAQLHRFTTKCTEASYYCYKYIKCELLRYMCCCKVVHVCVPVSPTQRAG